MQTTLDIFKIKNPVIHPVLPVVEEKKFVPSRMGCEKCNYFEFSFQRLPCGNCIQDFYLHGKKTLALDELLTHGFLLGKKGIKDLQTAHYVWDEKPAKYCVNPKDGNPHCPRCGARFLWCSMRIITKQDCSTCVERTTKEMENSTCKDCELFANHKPDWPVIIEQNRIQKIHEKAFCKGYYYDYDKWDCGWISCTNCTYHQVDKNGVDTCQRKLPMPNEETHNPDYTTAIYDREAFVVTPENQHFHHHRIAKEAKWRNRIEKERSAWKQ